MGWPAASIAMPITKDPGPDASGRHDVANVAATTPFTKSVPALSSPIVTYTWYHALVATDRSVLSSFSALASRMQSS